MGFTCNSATFEAEVQNSVNQFWANSMSISVGWWIVWASVIERKKRNLNTRT